MSDEERCVPLFVPALAAILIRAEDKKGSPLTSEEVLHLRDSSPCIMMTESDAAKMSASRGPDLDPENCWYDWQMLRRELGRLPDLDPGPRFNPIRDTDPEYQAAVTQAKHTLENFRARLPAEGDSLSFACLKTVVSDGDRRAFMWLNEVCRRGRDFEAQFFEVPAGWHSIAVGDRITIREGDVLDWSLNEDGELSGGYSLRYQRSKLPEGERSQFDEYIGVSKYV